MPYEKTVCHPTGRRDRDRRSSTGRRLCIGTARRFFLCGQRNPDDHNIRNNNDNDNNDRLHVKYHNRLTEHHHHDLNHHNEENNVNLYKTNYLNQEENFNHCEEDHHN